MFSDLFQITLIAATLASALVAGVFLTFSDFVMRSLSRARPAAGIEAMQIINREVYRSQFMVLLVGMAIAAITLAAVGLVLASGPVVLWLLAGAAAYLGGVMAVTVRANAPMNQRLDSQDPHSASAHSGKPTSATGRGGTICALPPQPSPRSATLPPRSR